MQLTPIATLPCDVFVLYNALAPIAIELSALPVVFSAELPIAIQFEEFSTRLPALAPAAKIALVPR